MNKLLFTILLLLAACTPSAAPTAAPQVITVYASPVTQTWLTDAYQCAQGHRIILSNTNDPAQAELAIRMGEPDALELAAYQIGRDDLLIVAQGGSPLQELTAAQARALFSDPATPVQVWLFPATEDIQQVFAREVLQGAASTSRARLAFGPQQMLDELNKDKNAIGILPRGWKTERMRELFTLADVPILALTGYETQGALKDLLACLQKK